MCISCTYVHMWYPQNSFNLQGNVNIYTCLNVCMYMRKSEKFKSGFKATLLHLYYTYEYICMYACVSMYCTIFIMDIAIVSCVAITDCCFTVSPTSRRGSSIVISCADLYRHFCINIYLLTNCHLFWHSPQ